MMWKIVISFVVVEVLVGNLGQAEAISCYKCTNCVELIDDESQEQCEDSSCAIWQNSANEIERGCKPNDAEAKLKYECNGESCNDRTVLVCQHCSDLDDCEDTLCKIVDEGDPDQCYISKSDESRGCVSELGNDYNKNDFEFCSEPNCNRVAVCVECNSDDDSNCRQDNLVQYQDKKCPNKGMIHDESCYRKESGDGSLELGCTSKLGDYAGAKTCSGDNCNKKDFIRCYDCSDSGACVSIIPKETNITPCQEYPTSCLTGYTRVTGEVYRGCLDILGDINESGFDFHETCDESLCNGKDFPDHLKCYLCTANCVTPEETSPDFCPNKDAQFCYTLWHENKLIYGCDKDELSAECIESKNCHKCYDDDCNDPSQGSIQCSVCEGAEQCKEPAEGSIDCEFCFMSTEIGQLRKGCASDVSCGMDNCEICSESSCNEQHCVHCSSENDPDCITGKGNVGYELCKDGDKCVAYVNDKGFVVRGCKSSHPALECGVDCEFDGPGSNDEEFPLEPLQCYRCNEEDCDLKSSTLKYCESNKKLGCYFKFNGDEIIERGCVTTDMQCNPDQGCYICTEGNNCNNKEPIPCNSCIASNADDDCLGDPENTCKSLVGCVTIISDNTILDGNNVVRGCAGELCNDGEPGCENICSTEYCNNQEVCYKCDDCNTIEAAEIEMCITQQSSGCYTKQDLDDKKISRGCVEQLSNEECQKDINCIVCNGTMCNVDQPMQEALQCSKCDWGRCADYAPASSCDNNDLLIDRCVEYALLGVTFYKGCLSDTSENIKALCLAQKDACTFCNKDFCNTEALSCYQCSTQVLSFECLQNPRREIDCNPGDSCTSCLDAGGHLLRGCSSDLSQTCSAQGDDCYSPNCNKDPFPTERLECHQCQNCTDITQNKIKPCLPYKDKESCYVQVEDEFTVHRGCTTNAPESCENCLVCNDENGCNSMGPWQDNNLSCITCTSNTDCEGIAFGRRCQAQLLIGRSDSCYTQFVGELPIAKGCLSDLPQSNPFYDECQQNSANCETCSTPDCNKGKALCYRCNSAIDEDCSELASLTNYRTECEGECVAKLDNEGFTDRGCIEDFKDFNEADCESSGRCQVCKGKNCNTATLPKDNYLSCYQCKGSDPACLQELPAGAILKACRRYVPGDKCYVRAENATWITRGCLSDLTDEESCDEPCLVCNENGCNLQGVLKPNTLVCVSCEGTNCQGQKDGKLCTEEILLGREDSCYHYDDGQTVQKGCLSDLMLDEESAVKESCEAGDEETCKLCQTNGCNGEYHYCVSCESSEVPECAGRMGSVPGALVEDCDVPRCVSRFEDNTVIKGCASATEPCGKNDPNCSECEGNSCNNIPFPVDRILCHQCSSCNDVTTAEAATCPNYNPEDSCFTRLTEGTIQRGCLSEATQECDELCFTCTSNGCNNEPSRYVSNLSCIQCRGGTQCKEATEVNSAKCDGLIAFGETEQCYTLKIDGEVVERGCVASQATKCSPLIVCEELTCSCDNCNLAYKDEEFTCHKCEGKDCGNAISVLAETCRGIACVSYVSRDGIVSRGCLQDYQASCSIYGNRHSLCFGNQCNGEIYPVGRMTCYQCDGCTSTEQEQGQICGKYVENDGCYTLTDGTYVKRGCLSDLPFGCIGGNCEPCSDPDCNRKEITTQAPPTTTEAATTTEEAKTTEAAGPTLEPITQSCIICSETSDESCAWALKPSDATSCPSDPVNDADSVCFSCLKDSLAVRGCTADLNEDTCDTDLTECEESECNTASLRSQKCAICTRDCDGSKASYTVQSCAGEVEYAQRGCYVFRNAKRIVTERGCFADLSEEQQKDCLRDENACWRCTGDVCNGVVRMQAFLAMIVGAMALVLARVRLV